MTATVTIVYLRRQRRVQCDKVTANFEPRATIMLLTPPGLNAATGKAITIEADELALVQDPESRANEEAVRSDLRTILQSKQEQDRERRRAAQAAVQLAAIETELHNTEQRHDQARHAGWESRQPAALDALAERIDDLKRERQRERDLRQLRSVKAGIDPEKLQQAGWGLVFPYESEASAPLANAILAQLAPLVAWRCEQAGKRYHEPLLGNLGYRPRESKLSFLARLRTATAGAVDPERLPYYLLLIGSPEQIPWNFQTHLDVQYAVGRLYFDDLAEYRRYAESVVRVEKQGSPRPRRVALWAPSNENDLASEQSCNQLVVPLFNGLQQAMPGLDVQTALRAQADRKTLRSWLGGSNTPSLLLTAAHGLEYEASDPLQYERQGGLVCAEWPGASWSGPLAEDFFLTGDQLRREPGDASGLIAFCFSCYTGGCPKLDAYAHHREGKSHVLAPKPFVGGLPRALLGGLSEGSALSVIAHVDRAWSLSFLPPGTRQQAPVLTADFQSALQRLCSGAPVGLAMEYFNQRYAELSTLLSERIDQWVQEQKRPTSTSSTALPEDLISLWTAHNDARDYVVLGDPAVRLPTLWQGQASELSTAPMPVDLARHISLSAWQRTAPDVQDLLRQLSQSGLAKLLATIEPLRDDS